MKKRCFCFALTAMLMFSVAGCMPSNTQEFAKTEAVKEGEGRKPALPEEIVLVNGMPEIAVYNTATDKVEKMDIETYVQGVLAGEMHNDWPMEALKAQAILARTFVLNFISEKNSMYDNADISTDIKEAQAYDASKVNARIQEAVKQTYGLVLTYNGRFPKTWFHAHAGGITELPSVALAYKDGDPGYARVLESADSDKAPDNIKQWKATFSLDDIEDACENLGINTGDITSFEIGSKGESGRAAYFVINGKKVSAPELRIQLGSTEMKSTLLTGIDIGDEDITFTGKGYGHGVGMSQWGAYAMAEFGDRAEIILSHYYPDTDLVKIY